jgi:hypothetical protein
MTDDFRFRPGLEYLENLAARQSKDEGAEANLQRLKIYLKIWITVLALAAIGFLLAYHFN